MKVLSSLPALQPLFAGFEAAFDGASEASDERGFTRASLVEQLLVRWKVGFPAPMMIGQPDSQASMTGQVESKHHKAVQIDRLAA